MEENFLMDSQRVKRTNEILKSEKIVVRAPIGLPEIP